MTALDAAPVTLPGSSPALEGDASAHIEELLVGELPPLEHASRGGQEVEVEVVGPHLRLSGTIDTGSFRRLSDFLNHRDGLLELRDATVLRRNGDPTRVHTPSIWLSPADVTLIGEREPGAGPGSLDMRVAKVEVGLVVVSPGHTLTGNAHLMPEAQLSMFIESPDPVFLPLTDVRTRSLADRRVIARYAFALLNRRHVVAVTRLLPGMAPVGRGVL